MDKISTGLSGLDYILNDGLIKKRSYLIRGEPGAGKTTLGLHFLQEGVRNNENVLFVTFGEDSSEIKANGEEFGFDIDDIEFLDLSPSSTYFDEDETYDIFNAAEVEMSPIINKIKEKVEELQPSRVFIDSITQFRYLTLEDYQFHKQVLSFLQFLKDREATILFTSEPSPSNPDDDLQFLTNGVINLVSNNGNSLVKVSKFRGSSYRKGEHVYKIKSNGIQIYPSISWDNGNGKFVNEKVSFGIPELNEMLHGGIARGTSTFIAGSSGVGKTTLSMQFIKEAAERGERASVYLFEENPGVMLDRCKSIQIPVEDMIQQNKLSVTSVEPMEYSTQEFAHLVKEDVEKNDTRIVLMDSVNGYKLMMRDDEVEKQIYSLCKFLNSKGVTVLLVNEIKKITGEFTVSEHGISYLADNLIFLRYLESEGKLSKAIGVLKKRTGDFQKSLREFEITRSGIRVGEPLLHLRGILTGTPESYVLTESSY